MTSRLRLSNTVLLLIISTLGAGILLDGTWYNQTPEPTPIHAISLDEVESVTVEVNQQQVLALRKSGKHWQQTHPYAAPVKSQRLQRLLDTNRYSQRSYAASELPVAEIFTDNIILIIDDAEFQFGAIEPVSKLRYVRSEDHIYLQPDNVIPMLSAAENVFVDLQITSHVEQVSIDGANIEIIDAWSDLQAADIISNHSLDDENTRVEISVLEDSYLRQLTAAHSAQGYTISSDNGFTYLLSASTAEALGLPDLLSTRGTSKTSQ